MNLLFKGLSLKSLSSFQQRLSVSPSLPPSLPQKRLVLKEMTNSGLFPKCLLMRTGAARFFVTGGYV
jgi:hypothetical protein